MQKLDVNPEDYDVIFVGYPMWWYQMPMLMYTFFDAYDLSGKTIIPFNTHEGSGDGGTYDDIKELEPNATVLDGFNVRGSSADEADSDLDKWLAGLNY
jgi:flavodoxin